MNVDELREQVRARGLLPRAAPLVAMLSGGRDSVCLLDLATAIRGADAVHALHVNYGLRADADGDERHCRELCRQLGVELEVVRAPPRPSDAGNLQAWARELRYCEAERLASRLDEGVVSRLGDPAARARTRGGVLDEYNEPLAVTAIATGHTASDQVETILYRLAASPGRRALLGMPAREGRLVRPLLELMREQTADYCRARRLSWREDSSNDDERYARARVRHGLVPALRAVHPAAEANVLRTAQLLRAEAELLEELLDAELAGADGIALERLARLPPALARLLVIRLAEQAAGDFVPQAGTRVSEILALGRRGGRAELHVGGLLRAVVADGRLRMERLPPRD
ncbi:MAG TPA: tRNA lysidine(34) synthetase TilS [Solirubrobacteraceae bacterium]|jgi:tRNA(Ile)-lysidine synthase